MKRILSSLTLAAILLTGPSLSRAVAQATYKLVDLSGGTVNVTAINNLNHVVFKPDSQAALWIDANNDGVAQSTEKISLGVLVAGGTSSGSGINDNDEVVGFANVNPSSIAWTHPFPNGNPGPTQHTFLWNAGVMRDLNDLNGDGIADVPDWVFEGGAAINNSRLVMGSGAHWDGSTWTGGHAFLYDLNAGTVTLIQFSDLSTGSAPLAMNQSGQVTFTDNAAGSKNSCLYSAGAITKLNVFYAYGLGDGGTIVGADNTSPGGLAAAFYMASATSAPLYIGNLGGGVSDAYGVNLYGTTIGISLTKGGAVPVWHAFRWKPGQSGLTDLNSFLPKRSTVTLTGAQNINNNGWIVGHGTDGSANRTYVLIPQ